MTVGNSERQGICAPNHVLERTPHKTVADEKTVSYAELAEMSGHAGAYRAAGNANGRNPIPIIIPCHRVIRSDGNIGGYSLGTELKTRLLRLEGTI